MASCQILAVSYFLWCQTMPTIYELHFDWITQMDGCLLSARSRCFGNPAHNHTPDNYPVYEQTKSVRQPGQNRQPNRRRETNRTRRVAMDGSDSARCSQISILYRRPHLRPAYFNSRTLFWNVSNATEKKLEKKSNYAIIIARLGNKKATWQLDWASTT